jgi:hypothetical protein
MRKKVIFDQGKLMIKLQRPSLGERIMAVQTLKRVTESLDVRNTGSSSALSNQRGI